jgi:AhpD family alkylhydroperoxidase
MTTSTTPRIDLAHLAGAPAAAMHKVEERIDFDPRLRELVRLRASLINGCAFCIDMHWSALRRDGEPEVRLAQLAAWEESPYFDDRERAALALTDAVTHVSATHVPDAVWARAEAHFAPAELAHLLFAIAAINLWNRLGVSVRGVPASYTDGAGQGSAAA